MSVLKNASTIVVARTASMVLQFSSTLVLARLLTPEDYGVFAIAAGAAALFYALRLFGTGNYLVRSKQLDATVVGTAFFVTFILSFTFGVLLAAVSPILAEYYGNETITPTLLILAMGFVMNPFPTISHALLQREERFITLAKINLLAAVIGAITMIILGYLGAGPLSLATGALASIIVSLISGIFAKPQHLTFTIALVHWRKVIRFGGWLTGVSMATQFSEHAAGLILGKTLSVPEAGIFEKGNTAGRIPHNFFAGVIQVVLFAAIAREDREAEDAKTNYLYRLSVLTALLWPVFIMLAFNGPAAVVILFGNQWHEAGVVCSTMALSWFWISPILLGDQVLIARNQVRLLCLLRTSLLIGRIVALLLVSQFGLLAASAALIVPAIGYALANQMYVTRELGASWLELMISLSASFWVAAAAVAAGLLTIVVFGYQGHENLLEQLVFSSFATLLSWHLITEVTNHPVKIIKRRIVNYAKSKLSI